MPEGMMSIVKQQDALFPWQLGKQYEMHAAKYHYMNEMYHWNGVFVNVLITTIMANKIYGKRFEILQNGIEASEGARTKERERERGTQILASLNVKPIKSKWGAKNPM